MTPIILSTIFAKRIGAYYSSFALVIVSLLINPVVGNGSSQSFDIDSLDMRLGAALAYLITGLILGHFSVLITKLRSLTRSRIEEEKMRTIMEQKVKFAFDLHDGIKSKVTAILLISKPVIQKLISDTRNHETELVKLWRWLNHLQDSLVSFVESLRPNEPLQKSSIDLIKILKEEITIVKDITDFECMLSSTKESIILPHNYKDTISRFIGEVIINVCKHSGVSEMSIHVDENEQQVSVLISDKGCGFNYKEAEQKKSSGLKSLAKRAEELCGSLKIDTAPGKGCSILLTFPKTKTV
jgi:signal transduction histidine kinase